MHPSLRTIEVTSQAIDVTAIQASVDHPAAGASACFVGSVRNHDHGRAVTHLEYEAHPQAQDILAEVAAEIAERFPLLGVSVVHRVGSLAIGDAALVAAVSTAHRGESFAALQSLVDLVKERIPVWKHQYFDDGTDEWVNCA